MDHIIGVTEAKAQLTKLIRDAESHDVILLRHGRPAAVLISPQRLDALHERLEDAEDRLSVYERDGVTVDYEKVSAEVTSDRPD